VVDRMGLDFETLTLPQQINDRPDFFRWPSRGVGLWVLSGPQ
jgi:hypothetical protein